jgi:hypothetical protein
MLRFAHLFLIAALAVLAGCAKKVVGAYVVNVIGGDAGEVIALFGRPDQRQSRTGDMESLIWKEGDFSVQSTTKDGKVMRLVFLSKDSTLMESVVSMVKERFSEGQSWHPEKKKVFADIVEVVVRGDSKITIYCGKEAIYVFGTEIW